MFASPNLLMPFLIAVALLNFLILKGTAIVRGHPDAGEPYSRTPLDSKPIIGDLLEPLFVYLLLMTHYLFSDSYCKALSFRDWPIAINISLPERFSMS